MQPGDIVESVDMEMSDDETDSKSKSRVLVDLRSQDRDMRVGMPPSTTSRLDLDMRISLPTGQIPGSRGGQLQDMHLMHSGPPPLSQQFQHQGQGGFRQEQPEREFHRNQSGDFHRNQPNFHQNRLPPPNFLPNQQDFHPNQQEFHQLHQSQQDFHQSQDFEYRDREHALRPKQDFLTESSGRSRYSQSTDQRDSSSFHRNERNNRGSGRGFSRNRRDRYSDDHNMKQRNSLANSRKSRSQDQQHQQSSPDTVSNSRPLILQPPDTVVILDEEGMPIGMPDFDIQDNNITLNMADAQIESEHDSNNCQSSSISQARRTSHDAPSSHESERNQQQGYQLGPNHEQQVLSSIKSDDQPSSSMNQVTVIPITSDSATDDSQQQNQYVPISDYEEHVESTEHSEAAEKTSAIDKCESLDQGQEVNFTENEQLDELMSITTSGNELKRPSTNGSFDEQSHDERNSNKKRILLPNGPQTSGGSESSGPNGPSSHVGTPTTEPHPTMMYDGPNFRPRLGAPFPPWRGGPPPPPSRGSRGFRGGPLPRGPWLDRGPRGPVAANYSPRGLKRGGGQFRGGGGFRGRGRGSNW